MRHHAIVVTSFNEKLTREAHAKALGLFGLAGVSTILTAPSNSYFSFFVGPDGSKEGWPESDRGDSLRELFIEWLREQYHEDGSSNIFWAEVQYGDDEDEAALCGSSDDDCKYFHENYEENEAGDWEPKAKEQA
jgi:hypothetical protein